MQTNVTPAWPQEYDQNSENLFQSYLGGEVPVQNGNGENNNNQQDEQALNLHDEFMQLCKSVGLEDLAKKQGFIQGNAIPDLKTYTNDQKASTTESTKATTEVKAEPTPSRRGRKKKQPEPPVPEPLNTSAIINESQDDGSTDQEDDGPNKKKRKTKVDKGNKGLRHFSRRVCEKVESKKVTSYNEVADELVAEAPDKSTGGLIDQKNIRRRVYDALNVLMAMNIIKKEKKEIRWVGYPTINAKEELQQLLADKEERLQRIRKKKEFLQELEAQETLYKNLITRNSTITSDAEERIYLPFIIIHTKKQTLIDCEMSEDKSEYFFDFSMPFTIHDDNEILRRMGLAGQLAAKPLSTSTEVTEVVGNGSSIAGTNVNSIQDEAMSLLMTDDQNNTNTLDKSK
jgi:predicted transcriptional regulator